MKKVTFGILFICILFIGYNAYGLTFKNSILLGLDGKGNVDVSSDPDLYETHISYSLIYEGYVKLFDFVSVGGGLEYQFPHKIRMDNKCDPTYTFIPVYFTAMFHWLEESDYIPYVTGQIGFNVLFDGDDDFSGNYDLDGEEYIAVGVGFYFTPKGIRFYRIGDRSYRFEIRYASYSGSYADIDVNVTYEEWSLLVGVFF